MIKKQFKTEKELTAYIYHVADCLNNESNSYINTVMMLKECALNVILSDITEDYKILLRTLNLFLFQLKKSMDLLCIKHMDILREYPLSLVKLCILSGIRGRVKNDEFENYLLRNMDSNQVRIVATHPSISQDIRYKFYEKTKNPIYLSKDIVEYFLF